eukprot:TRINITY_DN2177_c0_g3_i1.p1 TRINITY_DN2177_c0_g3~~TRINITY_DN2177_c0_g3_i1.p1  ORF type:complete len:465 (-),score=80.49 TRINITY_DN2177_c0_g3_i1:327-1721(-)
MSSEMASFSVEGPTPSLTPASRVQYSNHQFVGRSGIVDFRICIVLACMFIIILVAGGTVSLFSRGRGSKSSTAEQALEAALETESLLLPGAATRQGLQNEHSEAMRRAVPLEGILEVVEGTDIVWQLPPGKPSGAVFFAHGCQQAAVMFWDWTPNCSRCTGMPEDRALTQAALLRGLAVVAIKSRKHCWDDSWPPEKSVDVRVVAPLLDKWRKDHKLEAPLPFYGLGASSGGYFITILAHRVKFDALAVYISSGSPPSLESNPEEKLEEGGGNAGSVFKLPPTLFVHMPKDKELANAIAHSMRVLQEQNVEVMEVTCGEMPVTTTFFSERIMEIDKRASEEIYGILKLGGFLDTHDHLIDDPRKSKWKKVLGKQYKMLVLAQKKEEGKAEKVQRELMYNKISEELNLAYARHELTSLKAAETFDWFRGKCASFSPSGRASYRHHRCRSAAAYNSSLPTAAAAAA